MTVVTRRTHQRVDLLRTPTERAAFTTQLMFDWCGGRSGRLRGCAAMVLQQEGWQQREIAAALGMEPSGGAVSRLIERTRANLQTSFRTP